MPSRTRQSASNTEVAEPDDPSALRHLKFNEPLTWRVGRQAIPIADLLRRLQTLSQELRKLEQEEVEKESLKKVSQELATAQLLAHKDKGVRAWVACCIVDVLRLCAPDAPFTANQLKDLFTCIVTFIIPILGDPSNTYNAQHIYVLNSLAEVKSIVLLTDLDQPDSLIIPLFTTCFDIVSGSSKSSTGEEIAKNVEFDMTRLLVTVIDETPVLAPEVVDVIVAQFLRVDPRVVDTPSRRPRRGDAPVDAKQGTLLLKDYPPAYNMAKAICQACPERMTSHISQYFNNVIIDASATAKSGSNGMSKGAQRRPNLDESDEEGEDIKELSKAHRLIRELWRACPDVLQNVVPQLEAELSAESISLRLLATQTIGDLTAGIGVAGPPPPPPMDPAAYPPVTLADYAQTIPPPNILVSPFSPKPFSQAHSSTYESFLSRRLDRSASIRAAWVTVVGRILMTSAGGAGLSDAEEQMLIGHLASMLRDADEKVRVAAVDAVGTFGLAHIVNKLGASGGFSDPDSALFILAERVKDRKPQVREHAMKTLAQAWAVAAGEIEQDHEQVTPLLKDGPSKIFDAFYTNDPDIHVSIDRVLHEILLPLNYPPIKGKLSRSSSTQSSHKGKEPDGDSEVDVDMIRVRRILTLLKGLDDKAKKVFFALQARQISMRTALTVYLQACEDYNGGVIEKDEQQIKAQLTRVIDTLSKTLPDPSRTSADLWKFAKVHDRRSYQLMRFAMAAISDHRTVVKAIKELTRRIQSANNSPLLESLTPLLYRAGSLIFNKSHIPAIISLSRTGQHGLANPAHEMLQEISSRNPEVLEAQVQEMCKDLESQAPKAATTNASGTEEILKACSGFAKKLPSKLPKERRFFQALVDYALYSPSPRAAKHAVTILMATADKREMYARDLVHKCVAKWKYGADRFLTRLATLSQLNLLAPQEADEESDAIVSIAVNQVLLTNRSPQPDAGYTWAETTDDETAAKEWALRIIVNRLRAKGGSDGEADFRAHAEPVYDTLNKLVAGEGELSKKKDTPAGQKSRLRLLAAKSLLKLCASSTLCDQLLTPAHFNSIALVAQDPLSPVRAGFIGQLKKKLAQKSHLSHRWYTIAFLLAFEPEPSLKGSTLTWLRSRAAFFQSGGNSGSSKKNDPVMESIFSRLLSLLAYHPDYPPAGLDAATQLTDLVDFARYILFYLQAVANEHNLSLIFHAAQRVKQARDGITKSDEISTRLHTLSDLAQATIRRFADVYAQQRRLGGASGGANILQAYPGKMGIPSSIFAPMGSHREAQEVADRSFLPEDADDLLDRTVRSVMKTGVSKKRKTDDMGVGGQGTGKSRGSVGSRGSKRVRVEGKKESKTTGGRSRRKTDEDDWEGEREGRVSGGVAGGSRRRSNRGGSRRVSYAEDSDDVMEEEEEEEEDDDDEDEEDENGNENEPSDEEEEEEEEEPRKKTTKKEKEEEEMLDSDDNDSDLTPPPESPPALSSPPAASPPRRTRTPKQTPQSAKGKGKPTTSSLPTRRSSRR